MSWKDEYNLVAMLGAGAFGKVYKVEKNGILYAVKEVVGDSAEDEFTILKRSSHPNIVRFIKHFENKKSFLMEYADAGTMVDIRRSLSEDSINSIVQQVIKDIASALAYLHGNNIMHRDLKPANILCFRNGSGKPITFKLADFGISKRFRDSQTSAYNCSVAPDFYAAPEVIRQQEYTFSADMWCVGAIISFWCSGQHLFRSEDALNFNQNEWSGIENQPSTLTALVKSLLSQAPKDRPSARSVSQFRI